MTRRLFTSTGGQVQIGREIGRGGEGSVYEIPACSGQAAKIYHKTPDSKKQEKLRFMASTADARLLEYVAWPQDTLHSSRGGPVIGFLMPKVVGKSALHMVYSPAHRRQNYPHVAWDFLLCIARNVSASFGVLHERGHLIGDVNQNSFMVGSDSRVVLVDSDSLQVNAHGKLHLCEVGVSHFTPPELQSLSSFDRQERTKNHDNFGLALLIFHVLFGGRHPYSGVPLKSDVGNSLESDIQRFRYAYAVDSGSRGIAPPPRSIPISIVSNTMEKMFHCAFTEQGTLGTRPTAVQWLAESDALRGRLKRCQAASVHVYPNHVAECPWCKLEEKGVVYFVDLRASLAFTTSAFSLTQAWARIEAVPEPPAANIPSPHGLRMTARPLPSGIPREGTVAFYKCIVVAASIALIAAAPGAGIIILIVGVVAWKMAGDAGSTGRESERTKRRKALEEAVREYEQLVDQAKKEAGPEGFRSLKAKLRTLREEAERLPDVEVSEIEKLAATAFERQKDKFLEHFFIDSAIIAGVGPSRKAALRSFGIETAADVNKRQIMQIRGFGEGLTRAVLDWKASCERQFKFDSNKAVSQTERDAVRAKCAATRATIQSRLTSAPAELQQFRLRAATQLDTLRPRLEAAARRVAQAQADLSLVA